MNDSIDYKLQLLETDLYKDIISYGAVVSLFYEDANIDAINEGLSETITEYVDKVTDSAQQQWERYKSIVRTQQDIEFLQSIDQNVRKATPSFIINDYTPYSLNFLTSIKVVPFNYDTMKDALKNKDTFMQKYYPRLKIDGKYSIKKAMKRLCFNKPPTNILCNQRVLAGSLNFCMVNFLNNRKSIEMDLNTIEAAKKNILTTVNSIQLAQESGQYYDEIINSASKSIISEASTTGGNRNKTPRMHFTNIPTGDDQKVSQSPQNRETSFIRAVNTYMAVSTKILSTKMVLLRDIYKINMRILEHYAAQEKVKNRKNKPRAQAPQPQEQQR